MPPRTVHAVKRLLLYLTICILLLSITCVGVLLIKHQHKLLRFNKAKQAYMAQKYEEAKPLLRACLHDQFNDEAVNVMLAEIAEKEEEWPLVAMHWHQASKLNPFKTEYSDNYISSLKMTRNFAVAVEALEARRSQNTITQEQYLLLAFCQYFLGRISEAKETLENVNDETVKKSELASILDFFLSGTEHTLEKDLNFLNTFHESTDKFIAFETLLASAIRYARNRDLENGKKCMEKAAQISPITGKPIQAAYLFKAGIISEAMKVLEESTQQYASNEMGEMLGECYTMTRQADKLAELHKKFLTGSSVRITTGLYLEALHAFLTNNETLLTQNIAKWQENYNSTTATLVKLYAMTCADNQEETLKYLVQILRYQPFDYSDENFLESLVGNAPNIRLFNIHELAYNIGLRYVMKLLRQKQELQAAEIASVLQKYETPKLIPGLKSPNRLLARLVINYKITQGKLTPTDIDDVMKKFPGDPIIVNYLGKYYLDQGELKQAINLAKANLGNIRDMKAKLVAEGKEVAWDMTPLVIQLLNALESNYIINRNLVNKLEADGKPDEAKKLRDGLQKQLDETKQTAKELLAEKNEIVDNILYIDFCVRYRLVDELKEYANTVKEDDTDNTKALKLYARAQIAMLSEKGTDAAPQKQPEADAKKLPQHEQNKPTEAEAQRRQEAKAKRQAAVVEQLDKIATEEPPILFKIALLYAAVQEYEKANATYQKIIDKSGAQDVVFLNMSENYSALNQKEKALEYAQKAFELTPDPPIVQETYALRLLNVGGEENFKKGFDMLDKVVTAGSATQRGFVTWHKLMEAKLTMAMESKDWFETKTMANSILSMAPQDEQATKALKQAEDFLKEQTEKEEKEEK